MNHSISYGFKSFSLTVDGLIGTLFPNPILKPETQPNLPENCPISDSKNQPYTVNCVFVYSLLRTM